MDYETIVYGDNYQEDSGCYLKKKEVSWDRGEITEVELPIFGGFTLDDGTFISISDFMRDSYTKSIKMVLRDYYEDEVAVQEVSAMSKELEYYDDHLSCYFIVDDKLSQSLAPGSYSLYVYIQNKIFCSADESSVKSVFNEMVTGPSGLEIIIS